MDNVQNCDSYMKTDGRSRIAFFDHKFKLY
jgi:hypothetical protein